MCVTVLLILIKALMYKLQFRCAHARIRNLISHKNKRTNSGMTQTWNCSITSFLCRTSVAHWYSCCGWYALFCIIVTAILVELYTFAGELATVVYTNMIQCAVTIGGCLLVLILSIQQVGGLENLKTKIVNRTNNWQLSRNWI